ncbi:MAG: RNA pseudouridine synthase [Desulfatitalea sp.]|nr:RNA pseudouridine synthase [Desulfatitalea sp.]
MQRDRAHRTSLAQMAKQWLKERYNKPGRVFAGVVHRLDGPVAGVVVLARTSKAAGRLSDQFRTGRVEKYYHAVVQGAPPDSKGRLTHHMMRHGRGSRLAEAGIAGSQEAALSYRLLGRDESASLLEIILETGRKHQIRLQLAGIGCPIVGDRSYGADQILPGGCIALMARRLAFDHPTRAHRLTFECPLPVGWPWSKPLKEDTHQPLWRIEDYLKDSAEKTDFMI